MNKLLLSTILLVLPILGIAQGYRDGYVVIQNGDSLVGQLLFRDANPDRVKFKAGSSAKAIKYTPQEIRYFGTWDGSKFVSYGEKFATAIVSGRVSLMETGGIFFLMRGTQKIPLTRGNSENDYKAVLDREFKECGLSAQQIGYNRKDISNLVKNYHRCLGIQFREHGERLSVFAEFEFRAHVGYEMSNVNAGNERISFPVSSTISGGGDVVIWLPKNLKHFAFRGGLNYTSRLFQTSSFYTYLRRNYYDDYKINSSIVRIPLGAHYRFFNKPNTPYLMAGVSPVFTLKNEVHLVRDIDAAGVVTGADMKTNLSNPGAISVWYGAGYSFSVGRVKGFVEARFENGKLGVSDELDANFKVNSKCFSLGITF